MGLHPWQSTSLDSQIGATTLAMMQYIMLILYKQMHYGKTLGSLFDLISSQAEEENITRYLLEIFWEIVNGIGELLKADCMDLQYSYNPPLVRNIIKPDSVS